MIFHLGPRNALRKRRFTRKKGVPVIPSLKQPGFDGEIDQEENQEQCPKSLALTDEWGYNVLQNRLPTAREEQRQRPFITQILLMLMP